MNKEYENRIVVGDQEVEVSLDGEWTPPPEEPEVEAEAEVAPAPEPEPGPPPPRVDPEVLAIRQRLEQMEAETVRARQAAARAMLENEDRSLEGRLQQARDKYKAAAKDGNEEAMLAASEELAEIKAEQRARVFQKEAVQSAPPPPPPQPQVNPNAQRWLANNPWFGSREHAIETEAARLIDQQLANEGYHPSTEAYFDELNKRLAAKFRTVRPNSIKPQPKTPVQTAAPRGPKPVVKDGKVTLNRDDFQIMRQFGLDPNEPKHRLEYARQKVAYSGE